MNSSYILYRTVSSENYLHGGCNLTLFVYSWKNIVKKNVRKRYKFSTIHILLMLYVKFILPDLIFPYDQVLKFAFFINY